MRVLRVYDNQGGFTIKIPDDARVTFGYFNPASAGSKYGDFGGPGSQTMKTSALRIYAPGSTKTKENQIACFLGVTGFRDLDLLYEKVTPNDLP